jgi:TolB-like protein
LIGCASGPTSYFRHKPLYPERCVRIAIIPFANLTAQREAGKKVTYALITHLLNSDYLDVIEMGEVYKAIKDAKVRKGEDLSVDNIKKIGQLTNADVLLMGVVEEYKIDSSTMMGEKVFVPEVSISIRLVSTRDGSITWAANHHRRGDDKVAIFGMGRVDSISKLTDIIVKDATNSLMRAIRSRWDALDILKNGYSYEEKKSTPYTVEKTNIEDVGRVNALEPAIKEAEKGPEKEASTAIKVRNERQEMKAQYKEEYEKIKRQY